MESIFYFMLSSIFLFMFCLIGLKLENLNISSGSYFKEFMRSFVAFSIDSKLYMWFIMNVRTDGFISRIWLVEFFYPINLFKRLRLLLNVE